MATSPFHMLTRNGVDIPNGSVEIIHGPVVVALNAHGPISSISVYLVGSPRRPSRLWAGVTHENLVDALRYAERLKVVKEKAS